jgi:hypothetical protein
MRKTLLSLVLLLAPSTAIADYQPAKKPHRAELKADEDHAKSQAKRAKAAAVAAKSKAKLARAEVAAGKAARSATKAAKRASKAEAKLKLARDFDECIERLGDELGEDGAAESCDADPTSEGEE